MTEQEKETYYWSLFRYYKGEPECPFETIDIWWRLEKYAAEAHDEKVTDKISKTMLKFIKNKVWWSESGAPTTSWQEAEKRANELYLAGKWSAAYISELDESFPA